MKGEFDMTDILKDPKVVRETTEAQIAVHWGEKEFYYPPASFISQANLSDPDVNRRFSEENFPDCFQEYAEMLTWDERWHTTLDTNEPPFWKWFVGGKINACYNCVDRHLAKYKNKAALICVPELEDEAPITITYQELYVRVNEMAALLRDFAGLKAGDRVTIHMPMLAQLPITMLACARLGIIHSVVFGGFSGEACGTRISDSGSRVLITIDGYYRSGKMLNHKSQADIAVAIAAQEGHKVDKVLVWRRHPGQYASASPMVEGRDYFVDEELKKFSGKRVDPVSMDSEAPLFLMYTSGSTGKPKGCQHRTGGYLAYVTGTSKYIQDIHPTDVRLAANETKVVKFTPDKFAQLSIDNPRLWWPVQVGTPNLYTLKLQFEIGGAVSDESATRFGIREVTSILDEQNHRVFRINGKNVLIRGAGYTFDMMLRTSPEKQEAELKYVRDMNLNTVRMEGKLEDDHFFDLTDQMGILVTAGWCCCDHWEKWANWKDEDHSIAAASLRDQIRRLRGHPSVFNWMNGSDNPPVPEVEKKSIEIVKELDWPNPFESSATERPTDVSGKTGVKMTGPYDWVPPNYWLLDKTRGGAHGFNSETGPGPAIPPIESLRRMLPEDHLWPVNTWWDYHAGGGAFKDR